MNLDGESQVLVQVVVYARVRNLVAGGEVYSQMRAGNASSNMASILDKSVKSPLEGWLNNPNMVRAPSQKCAAVPRRDGM